MARRRIDSLLLVLTTSAILISSVHSDPDYSWTYIGFNGESPLYPLDYNKESVFMSGIAYDTKTRFMCAGFPAFKEGSEVAIGCFDTDKYLKGSTPVFDAFPSLWDNAAAMDTRRGRALEYNISDVRADLEEALTPEEMSVLDAFFNVKDEVPIEDERNVDDVKSQGNLELLRFHKRKRPFNQQDEVVPTEWIARPIRKRPHQRPFKFQKTTTAPIPPPPPSTTMSSSSSSSSTSTSTTTTARTTTTTRATITTPAPRKVYYTNNHKNHWRMNTQVDDEEAPRSEILIEGSETLNSADNHRLLLKIQQRREISSNRGENDRPYNFISVHHPYFDDCGRLWFIDTGAFEYSPNPVVIRKPILWSFRVRRGKDNKLAAKLYLRHEIEESSYKGLRSLVVDIHDKCEDYHVYIPNHVDNEIVVYSARSDRQWNFVHPVLNPVLTEEIPGQIEVGGVSSLALGKRDKKGYRPVYISVATGRGQFEVSSRTLRNRPSPPYTFHYKEFKSVGYKDVGLSTVAMDYDISTSVLFFATLNEVNLNCWNTKIILNPDTFGPVYSDANLNLGRDVKIDRRGNLWYLAGSTEALTGELADEGSNFEVHKFLPKDVIKGTGCELSP